MMLDLDNLDLGLDEDFPISPLSESNLFGSYFSGPGNQANENSCTEKRKNVSNQNAKNREKEKTTKDFILKLLESSDKNQEDNCFSEVQNAYRGNSVKNFNTLSGPNKCFDNEKKDVNVSKDLGKRILTHRKFPGPAGLLPDKPLKDLSTVNVIVENSLENISSERQKEAVILCSQTSSVFTEASFKKLASDFDLYNNDCPLNNYTIAWVKKRALKKTLYGKKIPFLAVILHNLDHGTPDPVITLRDQTGEIYGTLHREVWSKLGEKLQPGAALALRQVGVLITGIAKRQVHLNITSNNIINIYSHLSEETVEISCVNRFDKNDLIKIVKEWQNTKSNSELKVPSNPFSTVGCSKSPNTSTSYVKTKPSCIPSALRIRENDKSSCNKNIRALMGCPSNAEKDESKNHMNFITTMEDDMSDFMASLDDKILKEMKDPNGVNHLERDNNVRKRKSDAKDISYASKVHCTDFGQNFSEGNDYIPPTKEIENQKFILASQPLSQAETQIVEEVLDGIDLNDFDA